MPDAAPTVCFFCSLPVGEPARLNRLGNGEICPTCRDRVLATLPPLLPKAPSWVGAQRAEASGTYDDAGDAGPGDDPSGGPGGSSERQG